MANNLISFYDITYDEYITLKEEEKIDSFALYFLDNGQIYKGDKIISNVRLVYGTPEKGDIDTVYINKSTGAISFFNGSHFQDIFTPVDEITKDTNNEIPTASAVKKYVNEECTVYSYESLGDFPVIGKENAIYISKATNKTYRYSSESCYYVIGSDYDEITEINGNI